VLPARIAGRVGGFLRLHRWRILVLVAVLGFFTPMLLRWSESGQGDWGYFHFLDEVARRTVRDYGQVPEWNPYHCGGNVLAANTQGHTLSPWVVFPLLLGPTAGVKVSVVLHGLLGALGMWLLLGAAGLRGPGRFLGTLLFACSGFFGLQIAVGHVWVLPFYYVPFVMLFLLRGCYELRWAALAGALSVRPIVGHGGDGAITIAKVRSEDAAIREIVQRVASHPGAGKLVALLEYTDNRKRVEEIGAILGAALPPDAEILYSPLSSTSSVHMGPGTWGVAVSRE